MDYELIYYTAGRTAEVERVLDKNLSQMGLSHSAGEAATTTSELANALAKKLKKSQLIFVIGGLNNGYDSTDKVLSKILLTNDSNVFSKRVDGEKNSGYIIRAIGQTIVILPDEPDEVSNILKNGIISDLAITYSLKTPKEETNNVDDIMQNLDESLSGVQRVRLISAPPKPKLYKRSRRAKVIIGVLIALGAVLAITATAVAAIYYFIPYSTNV